MDCICDDNIAALIKSGFPPQDEIIKAWALIQEQCNDVAGDAEYTLYFRTFKEIADLKCQIKLIKHAVEILTIQYHKGIADELNKLLRTSFDFSKENKIELLNRCMNRSKSIKLNLDMKMLHFESMQSKFVSGKKPERKYFFNNLISISDHAGYQLTDQITTYEYYERIKRLNKYCESLNAKKNV